MSNDPAAPDDFSGDPASSRDTHTTGSDIRAEGVAPAEAVADDGAYSARSTPAWDAPPGESATPYERGVGAVPAGYGVQANAGYAAESEYVDVPASLELEYSAH